MDWLASSDTKEKCAQARKKLLVDKIDVTDYIVKVIEQYGPTQSEVSLNSEKS